MYRNSSGVAKIQSRKFGKKECYGDSWTSTSRQVRKSSNWNCSKCGKHFGDNKNKLHTDHILPISRGGSNSLGNLQALCAECHYSKHKRRF